MIEQERMTVGTKEKHQSKGNKQRNDTDHKQSRNKREIEGRRARKKSMGRRNGTATPIEHQTKSRLTSSLLSSPVVVFGALLAVEKLGSGNGVAVFGVSEGKLGLIVFSLDCWAPIKASKARQQSQSTTLFFPKSSKSPEETWHR